MENASKPFGVEFLEPMEPFDLFGSGGGVEPFGTTVCVSQHQPNGGEVDNDESYSD